MYCGFPSFATAMGSDQSKPPGPTQSSYVMFAAKGKNGLGMYEFNAATAAGSKQGAHSPVPFEVLGAGTRDRGVK
jgi:hypothetical protein